MASKRQSGVKNDSKMLLLVNAFYRSVIKKYWWGGFLGISFWKKITSTACFLGSGLKEILHLVAHRFIMFKS